MRVGASLLYVVLLVAAVVLFAAASFTWRGKRPWLVPAGLACFAGAFLVQALL